MKTVFIYVLRCPMTFKIRYVGKTKHPVERLRQHAYPKRHSHRACWIRLLMRKGLTPIFETVDEVPETEWPMWEVAYITFFREQGCLLVNSNAGGEGGHNPSEETRRKIGAAKVGNKYGAGRKMPEHVRQKIKLANIGRKHPGRKLSEEHKKKIAVSRYGYCHSEAAKEKMRTARAGRKPMLGKRHSPESKQKMRLAKRHLTTADA